MPLTFLQAALEDDAFRRERDDDSVAPPPSYHTRAGVQLATASNCGRPLSERQWGSGARSCHNASRSQVSEHDDRQRSSSSAKQRKSSTMEDDGGQWENSSQATTASIKDRISGIFGKSKQSPGSQRLESSLSYRSVPASPRSARSEFGFEQRRRSFSRVDDRFNCGMGRLDVLREEEPGDVRRLMPVSSSVQKWVERVPLTEDAVATFNDRPQLGRKKAQSEILRSSRRMVSQERVPESVAPGESAFSTVEPYDRTPTRPLLRTQIEAPTYHTSPFPPQSTAPSYETIDPQKNIPRTAVKSSEEEKQTRKEQDDLAAAIQESLKEVAISTRGDSKAVEKSNNRPDVYGWDGDDTASAIEQSIRETVTSMQSGTRAFDESNSYLTSQNREKKMVAHRGKEAEDAAHRRQDAERMQRNAANAVRLKREAEDAVRQVQEAAATARRQRDAEDADRRRRDAVDAARRKQESDNATRQHDAQMRDLRHATQIQTQEIAEQKREAEHIARMRELELADQARQLASSAQAREAESTRKLREERMAAQKRLADEEKRLADERAQLENETRKTKKQIAENERKLRERTSSDQRASASLADNSLPPYSQWGNEGMTAAVPNGDATYSQLPQPTVTAIPSANLTQQANHMPSAAIPPSVTVQSHVTITHPLPPYQPVSNKSHLQPQSSQTTRTSSSSGEIYRPPRRMGNIMPDSVTRIQQHYRFRRSLIERNLQEGRRTAEQGRAAIACLNRNEVADIDSEPRRTQELNVIGLEAFEADIELLDRLGGDQMAPPVPWAIPSLEAESRGNYNHAHLREHIERLVAQQNGNVTATSRLGSADIGSASVGRGGSDPSGFMSGGGGQYYEWYEEYRYHG